MKFSDRLYAEISKNNKIKAAMLDNLNRIRAIKGMFELIYKFPDYCKRAIKIARFYWG